VNPITRAADWTLGVAARSLDDSPHGVPERRWVSIEPAPWDNCCPDGDGEIGGQLTVVVGQTFTTQNFPEPSILPTGCLTGYGVPLTVELVRCAPTMDDEGDVDLGALQAAMEDLTDDGWLMMRQLQCALDEDADYDGLVQTLGTGGEMGGCWAVSVNLTIHLS